MALQAHPTRTGRPLDFFISYSVADERWASWIAWELETAGYQTMIQAWDFVPGSNFKEFIDRGVSAATLVIAVLSRTYMQSRWGRLEWQAALDPDGSKSKLVTVRTEDCELDGLLSTITFVDLVDVADPVKARGLLLKKVSDALRGRAKPDVGPGYPLATNAQVIPTMEVDPPVPPSRVTTRRVPVAAPVYPLSAASARTPRSSVTVMHLAAPRIPRRGADGVRSAGELQARLWGDVTRLIHAGAPHPDLLVVTGDLTSSGHPREFEEALTFLAGLRALLSLEPHRLVLVPGSHDINHAAARAYFANCDADDIEPQPPYWPKWRHFANLFQEVYQGIEGPLFDSAQPWSLFHVPDLDVVVAGFNSTMAESHRDSDRYGYVGAAQAAWFAHQLRPFEQSGVLRIGAVFHPPAPSGGGPADQAVDESTVLRDTTAFDRLVAGRLNLLLPGLQAPGRGAGSSTSGALKSGLPVVPTPAPGRLQLLTIDLDGLTRWTDGDGPAWPAGGARAGVSRLSRTWHAVGTTFPAAVTNTASYPPIDVSEPGAGSDPDSPLEGGTDPLTAQLERIAEVCRTRYDHAEIRRIGGAVPHLLVTYREDGYSRQLRVGAHLGPISLTDVETFIRHVHALEPDLHSEIVTDVPAHQTLKEEAWRRRVRVRSFREFQGLLDLSDFVAEQTARLADDQRYPADLYVPQRYRDLVGMDRAVRDGLTDELLRLLDQDDGRFILVLGDFGRGKSFALREVARRIPSESSHLTPIFIELRTLDKAHNVDGMVAAHLAHHGRDLIDLKAFRYLLRKGRIVLLFDGFDELVNRVTYDRAADHLQTLLLAAQDDAKIIVASRTHHFQTDSQVFTALGEKVGLLPRRRVLSIEEFAPSQVRTYLVNRYNGDETAAEERLDLIKKIQDLAGLSRNPRMLSFIADLDSKQLTSVAGARNTLSAAGLYRKILTTWLEGEEQRTRDVPGAPVTLRVDDLWTAVTTLALRLWESGEQFLRLAEISQVAATLTELAGGRMSVGQTAHAMGAGSLLTRTEEGLFGFIHLSVIEWFVANDVAGQFTNGATDPPLLSRRIFSQLAIDFLCDLATAEACRTWADRVLSDMAAQDVTRANALKVSARLRTPIRSDLRGVSLRGEDLSYREMQAVNFTGADLTDAVLTGTDLTHAVMRDTCLVAARLDNADLGGVDFTGADLTRARLLGSNLRDARIDGALLRRAAIVGATADPSLLVDARRQGAAVAPGQEVHVGLAPSAVGVSFGFESGRLPDPVVYSPDGGILAIASEEGGVLTCDAATGHPLQTLQGHHSRVYIVRYAGDVLVSGSSDSTVRLWEPTSGQCLHTLRGHSDWVWPVEPSPDGNMLAVGDSSGTVRLWDIAGGQIRALFAGHASRVWTAAFHPDGSLLATGDSDGIVRLWNTATGDLQQEISTSATVFRLTFSPDGTLLATAGGGGGVHLWDPTTGELREDLVGHERDVYTLDFHPEGHLLATGDVAGVVRIWGVAGTAARRVLTRHNAAVYRVLFSPDGTLLATGDNGRVVRLLDPVTGEQRHELTGHKGSVWPMVFRPDGGQIATSSNDRTARLWDPASGACVRVLAGHGRRLSSVRFSPDGSVLAASGNDGAVWLWDPRTGQRHGALTGATDPITSAVFAPVGRRIAATSSAGGVHLWNLDVPGKDGTGTYERELRVDTDYVWAQAFSPAGDMLATANDDDSVRLWYRTTGRHIRTFADHKGRVRSLAFSPDSGLLATGCDDRKVRVWDNETGECRQMLTGHTDRVYAVLFNPDGRILASASNDGTARLWNAGTGELLRVFAQHRGQLWAAAFSPGGTVLATAGDDLVVRLWDTESGHCLDTLAGHTRRIWSLDFSPDGTRLASCGDDGTARLWDVAQPGSASLSVTLVGHESGWAALAPDGGYKFGGDLASEIWHVIGMCRFEMGELDRHLDAVRLLPPEAPF
ncbi:WD40 repeat-containing protein [Candidatus Protofrankia californiensis]|uniref:WD40 repeat-containing protein n=1 Tax=Candidatus Protofrankia californiensis TaxID=1839754 RepID=A0A1C3NY51_9ACTN|nr:WD40 repeat-containing protein [Candidatus Protofrankia californiensis]